MFGMTYVSNFKSIRFFSIISFLILISCIIPTEQTKDDLYIKLEKEIMCPVCDGQTLDQSQSLIAEDMFLASMLENGGSLFILRSLFVFT